MAVCLANCLAICLAECSSDRHMPWANDDGKCWQARARQHRPFFAQSKPRATALGELLRAQPCESLSCCHYRALPRMIWGVDEVCPTGLNGDNTGKHLLRGDCIFCISFEQPQLAADLFARALLTHKKWRSSNSNLLSRDMGHSKGPLESRSALCGAAFDKRARASEGVPP